MVSVVIPAYNEEKYLPATLESLVGQQTQQDFEVIVVDNASTDRTSEIAKSFASRLKHLRVVLEKEKGRGRARVTGFSQAKGDIILCTDADTVLPPQWIDAMTKPFEDASVMAASSAAVILDFDAFTNWIYNIGDLLYMWSYRVFLGYNTIVGFSLAVRREAYEKSGGFRADLKAQEDVEFGMRLHKQGKIVFLPQVKVIVSGRRFKDGILNGILQYIKTTYDFFVLKKSSIDLEDVR